MLEPDFPEDENLRITTLKNLNILDTPSEQRFDRLTRIAQQLFDVPIVLISLVDTNRQWFKSSLGIELSEFPRSISFCGHAILNSEVFVIPDTNMDYRFADNPVVTGPPYVRFYAGQPLRAANGQLVGTLCVLDQIPRVFNHNNTRLLQDIAALVEKEINFPDLKEVTQKLTRSENKLLETVEKLNLEQQREKLRNSCLEMISRGLPLNQILSSIINAVEQQKTDVRCCILSLGESTKSLKVISAPSMPEFYIKAIDGLPARIGSASCGSAAASGTRIIVEDIETHPYWESLREVARQAGIKSCWSQPVISCQGDILGVFSITSRKTGKPSQTDIQLMKQTANLVGIALVRDRNDKLIQKQANFDSLTGLPNRLMFKDRLNQEIANAKRNDFEVALFFLDLDNFKDINDTLGHDKGDQLLKEVARRLSGCMRNIDTVARFGGDEFAIIMGQLSNTNNVDRIANELIAALSRPFPLSGRVAYLSTSIGISFFPDNASNSDDLIKNADQAMYAAKNKGRSRFQYYSATMQKKAMERMSVLNDLQDALKEDQLQIYYQPIVDLKSGSIDKAEALLRWLHPQHGLLNPQDFISIAEGSAMIIKIGEWVMQQVLNTLCNWRQNQHTDFQISINTSSVQYRDTEKRLLKCLEMLDQSGLPGQALTIDISEKLLLENRPETIHQLKEFSNRGVNIALDDFGIGYSSLDCLKNSNLDYVKIDSNLIECIEHDPESLALCEGIIVMAQKLGLKVIAEGVETEQQRSYLIAAGCDYAQGYLFSPAVSENNFKF